MHAFIQCHTHIRRNASVIFSYNPRISPAPRARTGVTRSYLIYVLLSRQSALSAELHTCIPRQLSWLGPNLTSHVHVSRNSEWQDNTYDIVGSCGLLIYPFSHPRQLIFLWKSDCLGCAVLFCLVVCLTMLASFFLYQSLSIQWCE